MKFPGNAMFLCFIVQVSSSAAATLPTPYLISATATSSTRIQLLWRNNSTAYESVAILRKNLNSTVFKAIDTVSGVTYKFTDSSLIRATTYTFRLIAYTSSEESDTSDSLSATTLDTADQGCSISLKNNDPDSPAVVSLTVDNIYPDLGSPIHGTFNENACDETGIILLRSENFGIFVPIDTFLSQQPAGHTSGAWSDSSVTANTWYTYQAVAYNSAAKVGSLPSTLYTFSAESFFGNLPSAKTGAKLAEMPLYADSSSWALMVGDSILVKETTSPESSLSVIDVSQPQSPQFKGYTKVTHLPLAPKLAYCHGDAVFDIESGALVMYAFRQADLASINSKQVGAQNIAGILNDSTLVVSDSVTMFAVTFGAAGIDTAYPILRAGQYSRLRGKSLVRAVAGGKILRTYTIPYDVSLHPRYLEMVDCGFGFASTPPSFTFMIECGNEYNPDGPTCGLPPVQIPSATEGILLGDSVLSGSWKVLLDAKRALAFTLDQNELTIYQCNIGVQTSAAGPRNQLVRANLPSRKVRKSIMCVPPGSSAYASWRGCEVFDLRGRRLGIVRNLQSFSRITGANATYILKSANE